MGTQRKKLKTNENLKEILLGIPKEGSTALAIIDRNFKVCWTNDALEKLFPDTVGKTCYETTKGFERPCDGCPIQKSLIDRSIHLALMPAPPREENGKLKYSQIIAIPLEFDEENQVEKVLHILLDCTKEQENLLESEIKIYDFCNCLWKFILNSDKKSILKLILFSGVSKNGLNFDEAEIIIPKNGSNVESPANFDRLLLKKKNINEKINKNFFNAKEFTDFYIFSDLLERKIKSFTDIVLPEEITKSFSELAKSQLPVLIDINQITASLGKQFDESEVFLILRSLRKSAFIMEIRILELTLFLSIIKRAYDAKIVLDESKSVQDRANKFLDECKTIDPLVEAVPFAIGKVHDLGLVQAKIHSAARLLRDLSPKGPHVSSTRDKTIKDLNLAMGKLRYLIKSMKSISKISKPTFRNVDLQKIFNEVVNLFNTDLSLYKIKIDDEKVLSITIECDEGLITQVFFNLLDNSIKSLKTVKQRVRIIQVRFTDMDDKIEIQFSDNGIGIAPHNIDRIWERFFSTRGGSGAGLYFTKHIVNKIHNGEIKVESDWGQFTTFIIVLPKIIARQRG